jgi:hypothetical protein
MSEIIISEKQLGLIQDLITKEENFKLAEQNWKRFSNKKKTMVLEIYKELYPEKTNLIKESKWYNTLGDIAGIFDPTGIVDLVNGISYINQGDNLFGFLSLVSAVPYAGDLIAKPVMGALKIGAPSAKALEAVLKTAKSNPAKAAKDLEVITRAGGMTGKFVEGVGKVGGKLRGLVERIPLPGGLKRTLLQWIDLFASAATKGKGLRVRGAEIAGELAKNVSPVTRSLQIAKLAELTKAAKEAGGLFSGYRTSKGVLSWKTLFGGMPQLIGRNKSVRALVRQTKFWAGFLDFLGLANFVGPDELAEKMGQSGMEEKLSQYQQTPQGKEYFEDSFGSEESQEESPTSQTSTPQSSSQSTSQKNPIGDYFKSVLGGQALSAIL